MFARPLYLANSKRINNVNGEKSLEDSEEFCSLTLQKGQILLHLATTTI